MRNHSLAATLALLIAVTSCFAEDAPNFKIAAKRADDRVEVKSAEGKVMFVVRSPMGISHMTIERTEDHWPDKAVIQLRLNGLENLKVSTDKLKLEASVSSHDGDIRLWKDGQEDSLLDPKSPYWMEIRILDSDGELTKAVPLKDGCFEIALPKKLFDGNPRSIKVEWIDFYRN